MKQVNAVEKIESVLRINRIESPSSRVRARAVYVIGIAFIAVQVVNQVGMTITYGGIVLDHYISIAVSALFMLALYGLRYNLNFVLYASFYSALIFIGTLASALPDGTGINSALLPVFMLGCAGNGFICGKKAVALFFFTSLIIIWYLYSISMSLPAGHIWDPAVFGDRNFQRAFQCTLSLAMMSIICAFFSHTMHDAFETLAEKVDRAEESDRAKTQFLANMSHELRTPMNGILGISDVLLETDMTEEQIELTTMINQSGEALIGLISNVLLFSQIESDSIKLTRDPFVLKKTVLRAAAPHRLLASQKKLGFNVRIPENIPPMYIGDAERLTHAISSLVDNAVKFTAKGHIDISVMVTPRHDSKQRIVISVKDSGIGINESDLAIIFETFRQADERRKRRFGGTGLGLTVARGLVNLMGGEVSAMSRVGAGSIFSITLDLKPAEPVQQPSVLQGAEMSALG